MSGYYFFPDDVLRNMMLSDLWKLADYYGIKYRKNTPPKTIISEILDLQGRMKEHLFVDASVEGENISVRVKRIRESNKE